MPAELDHFDADGGDEFDDDNSNTLYLKYCFEGVTSVGDLAIALRSLAEDLDRGSSEGWRLDAPVEGGWAHLVREV